MAGFPLLCIQSLNADIALILQQLQNNGQITHGTSEHILQCVNENQGLHHSRSAYVYYALINSRSLNDADKQSAALLAFIATLIETSIQDIDNRLDGHEHSALSASYTQAYSSLLIQTALTQFCQTHASFSLTRNLLLKKLSEGLLGQHSDFLKRVDSIPRIEHSLLHDPQLQHINTLKLFLGARASQSEILAYVMCQPFVALRKISPAEFDAFHALMSAMHTIDSLLKDYADQLDDLQQQRFNVWLLLKKQSMPERRLFSSLIAEQTQRIIHCQQLIGDESGAFLQHFGHQRRQLMALMVRINGDLDVDTEIASQALSDTT